MYSKIETIINSGYAFFKQLNDNETIYENKFTGMRLLYDFSREVYTVMEA